MSNYNTIVRQSKVNTKDIQDKVNILITGKLQISKYMCISYTIINIKCGLFPIVVNYNYLHISIFNWHWHFRL